MKPYLTLLLLLATAPTYAQRACNLTVTGIVVDEHDGSALGYASVWVGDRVNGVVADGDGGFIMSGLCEGETVLSVAHMGCDTLRFELNLKRDTSLQVFLEHHMEMLEMVRVEAKKPHLDIAGRQSVRLETIERMQAMSYADLLDDEWGVQMDQTGGNISKPMLHGLSGNRVALSDNGVIIKGQQWGSEHTPEIDPYAMEEVEVVFGASSLRYGPEALAGAIISKRKQDTNRALNGWVHLAGATNGRAGNASMMLRGSPFKRLPVFGYVQGTLGRSGDLSAPNYTLLNTGTRNRHWQGGLSWVGKELSVELDYRRFTSLIGIMTYAHIGNLTDLERAINEGVPPQTSNTFTYDIARPYQDVEHEISSARMTWRPQVETKLMFSFDRQFNRRLEFDNSIFSGDQADLQYELTTLTGQGLLVHRFSAIFKTEVGATFQRQANTYTGRFFIPNFLAFESGVFAIQHVQLGDHELEAGIRYDQREQEAFMYREDTIYSPSRSFSGLSWNVGYSIDQRIWKFSSNIAQGWRPPAINELYSNGLHHGAAAIEMGDEQLAEEVTWSWVNQLEWSEVYALGIPWSGMLRAHASYYDQFIYLVPTGTPELTIRGAFPSFEYRGVDALIGGLDASLNARILQRLHASVGVEMVRGQEYEGNAPLIFMPADRADLRLRYGLDRYDNGRYVQIGLTAVNEQGRFPKGVDYALPPPAYLLLSSELSWNANLGDRFRAIASIRVGNLLNTTYRSYTNRLRYFADEMGRNISLALRIPFDFKPKTSQTILINEEYES